MKVLLIDNYDSFTFNLLHYVQQCTPNVVVKRNDEFDVQEVESYSHIIISPGPGLPAEAGNTLEVIKTYASTKPILGVCLGCQAIAEVYGGSLYNQKTVAHGLQKEVLKTKEDWPLLRSAKNPFKVGLYHSWAIDEVTLPGCLEITARSTEGVIMGIQHKEHPLTGVQFHPESIMTEDGVSMIRNWLEA